MCVHLPLVMVTLLSSVVKEIDVAALNFRSLKSCARHALLLFSGFELLSFTEYYIYQWTTPRFNRTRIPTHPSPTPLPEVTFYPSTLPKSGLLRRRRGLDCVKPVGIDYIACCSWYFFLDSLLPRRSPLATFAACWVALAWLGYISGNVYNVHVCVFIYPSKLS